MIKSLENLQKAFQEVGKKWSESENMDSVESDYPFEKSFDELNLEVSKWVDQSIKELENK